MPRLFGDQIEFFRQFRQRFHTTGAVAPSSRFLARAMTRPLRERTGSARVLEIGPGTGAVTRHIVRLLKPEDCFDLVEVNEVFADMLQGQFESNAIFRKVANQSSIHVCLLQDFRFTEPYDYVISGLPLNNFAPDVVQSIFDSYFELLAPGGVLSYFEYMYVRPVRSLVAKRAEADRLRSIGETMDSYLQQFRIRRDSVFFNLPPAWVQHLQKPAAERHETSE